MCNMLSLQDLSLDQWELEVQTGMLLENSLLRLSINI